MDSDDDDDFMDMHLTALDLNQEPTANQPIHRVTRYGSMLNELGTAHHRIEGRIRQLEAVTARTRLRQRWRHSRNAMDSHGETRVDVGLRSLIDSSTHQTPLVPERGKGCKRDSSHLVAKALEMGSDVKKPDKEGAGSFYDCNICLELAKDPVLTCCGHLFCWPCFYQVSHVDSFSKECPVCKGEVSDNTVTPIYGNGDSEGIRMTESGLQIPPRPKACRVESARQQRVTQQSLLSHVPVSEALRRIRISIGAFGGSQAFQPTGGSPAFQQTGHVQVESASGDHHRVRFHQVSRVLSESAASLSSLSSALSNAERLVEDLESVINNRMLGNEMPALPLDVVTDLPRPTGVMLSIEDTVGTSSSSFARRRNIMSRNLDLDARDPREPRRRRLN